MSTVPLHNESYVIPDDSAVDEKFLDLIFGLSRPRDPIIRRLHPKGVPLIHEDEGPEVGESYLHTLTCAILHYGLKFHFAGDPRYRVFENLNLYYSADDPSAYVSPDVMVVEPSQPLPVAIPSYRIGREGPGPRLTAEILSNRTYQQGDLSGKPEIYARLAIPEYILIDITGSLLPEKLLLLRRQADGLWREERNADGGVTSQMGFRLKIDPDGQLRVLNAHTGKRYARPDEAQTAEDARRQAEERIRALEEELARLRSQGAQPNGSSPQA